MVGGQKMGSWGKGRLLAGWMGGGILAAIGVVGALMEGEACRFVWCYGFIFMKKLC